MEILGAKERKGRNNGKKNNNNRRTFFAMFTK